MVAAKKRVRAVQQRAEDTRASLLRAGVELFSTRGYDGTSIRDVEAGAGVKRGLAAYHFGGKADLWKAAVSKMFETLALTEATGPGPDASGEQAFRETIRGFVRFSAAHPELNRLMVQEGKTTGWRSDYLVERFVRPRVEQLSRSFGRALDPHELYALIGASSFVFNVEYECEALFGVNPRRDDFVEAHADMVANLLLGVGDTFAKGSSK